MDVAGGAALAEVEGREYVESEEELEDVPLPTAAPCAVAAVGKTRSPSLVCTMLRRRSGRGAGKGGRERLERGFLAEAAVEPEAED